MSTTPTDDTREDASPLTDLPVSGADSFIEVIRSPDLLRDWITGLQAPNLEKTREVSGSQKNHTIGENIVRALNMRTFPTVLRQLESTPDPITGTAPHRIVRAPTALLDNLIHMSSLDDYRLEYGDFSELPDTRQRTFEYLADPDTAVDPSDLEASGGTDALIHGPMGRGKTTNAVTRVARNIEVNNEAVVWRGTSQRTEWLPLAPWTILCLPEGVDYQARLHPPEDNSPYGNEVEFDPLPIALDDLVWRVERYESIEDLNHNILLPGAFHVVYPDPHHRGAEEATERADECPVLPYTGPTGEDPTPPLHWWYAWLIHQNAFGRSMRVGWVCDEASNVFEQSSSNDDHQLNDRIKAIGQQYVDFRRNGISIDLLTQKPREISWRIRKKMRWVNVLSGASNAHKSADDIIGTNPPMERELTSNWEIGRGLSWTAGAYTEFHWDPLPHAYRPPGKVRIQREVAA